MTHLKHIARYSKNLTAFVLLLPSVIRKDVRWVSPLKLMTLHVVPPSALSRIIEIVFLSEAKLLLIS